MTTQPFTLRAAVAADLPDLMRLIRALANYEERSHEVVATEADIGASLFGPQAVASGVVAEVNGRAVGMAIWFYNFSTFTGRRGIYIEDAFVEPECRGSGIGRAIFAHLAARAVDEGCVRLEWSVLDWNEPSIRFYRSIGAVGLEEWTKQRLSDDPLAALARTSHG